MSVVHQPSFELSVRPDQGRVFVELSGELDCATAPRMSEALAELRAAGWSDIVMNVDAVTFVDSTGLHALYTAVRGAEQGAWRLVIGGCCPSLDRLAELTGLAGKLPRS